MLVVTGSKAVILKVSVTGSCGGGAVVSTVLYCIDHSEFALTHRSEWSAFMKFPAIGLGESREACFAFCHVQQLPHGHSPES